MFSIALAWPQSSGQNDCGGVSAEPSCFPGAKELGPWPVGLASAYFAALEENLELRSRWASMDFGPTFVASACWPSFLNF